MCCYIKLILNIQGIIWYNLLYKSNKFCINRYLYVIFSHSKYEEIFPPNVSEFVYITDDTYSKKQVIRMEHLIIKILSFDLSIPTPLTFITATCIINKQPEKTMFLAMVSCEILFIFSCNTLNYSFKL